jgi:hypothetical protein
MDSDGHKCSYSVDLIGQRRRKSIARACFERMAKAPATSLWVQPFGASPKTHCIAFLPYHRWSRQAFGSTTSYRGHD